MVEVEQKFRCDDFTPLLHKLNGLQLEDVDIVEQVDSYFNHPSRDFASTDEALRLRQVGNTAVITYKGPKLSTTTKAREEIELSLGGGASSLASWKDLLQVLGFRPVAIVQKKRHTFQLPWGEYRAEVALDDVAGLGLFCEIEITIEENDFAPAELALLELAQELDLTIIERKSYLELLLGT